MLLGGAEKEDNAGVTFLGVRTAGDDDNDERADDRGAVDGAFLLLVLPGSNVTLSKRLGFFLCGRWSSSSSSETSH